MHTVSADAHDAERCGAHGDMLGDEVLTEEIFGVDL